jgi:copper chaperone CopZ
MKQQTQIKITLTGVHLCCQGCVNAVDASLAGLKGVESWCDKENRTVTITASDDATAQKALDLIAAAGFHGSTENEHLTMKAVSGIPHGKVKRLLVSEIHNCCDLCCEAIKEAIATVDGVTGDTADPGAASFEVAGNFEAAAMVTALNAAGFSARVRE